MSVSGRHSRFFILTRIPCDCFPRDFIHGVELKLTSGKFALHLWQVWKVHYLCLDDVAEKRCQHKVVYLLENVFSAFYHVLHDKKDDAHVQVFWWIPMRKLRITLSILFEYYSMAYVDPNRREIKLFGTWNFFTPNGTPILTRIVLYAPVENAWKYFAWAKIFSCWGGRTQHGKISTATNSSVK